MIIVRYFVWWIWLIVHTFAHALAYACLAVAHLIMTVLFIPMGLLVVSNSHEITQYEWPWDRLPREQPHEDYGGTDGQID